jgi:hypothetical protein
MMTLAMTDEKYTELVASLIGWGKSPEYLNGVDACRAAMTEIDIPDGCVLAIVRDIHTGRKFDDKFNFECFNVGRIVQEVKL